mmetsp:Transcript_15743/g.34223  ORF Transcript_15743/g.34223 Transcript_15743/m.34223 type:complete len:257 (+) Transcript_15743:3-773(+)
MPSVQLSYAPHHDVLNFFPLSRGIALQLVKHTLDNVFHNGLALPGALLGSAVLFLSFLLLLLAGLFLCLELLSNAFPFLALRFCLASQFLHGVEFLSPLLRVLTTSIVVVVCVFVTALILVLCGAVLLLLFTFIFLSIPLPTSALADFISLLLHGFLILSQRRGLVNEALLLSLAEALQGFRGGRCGAGMEQRRAAHPTTALFLVLLVRCHCVPVFCSLSGVRSQYFSLETNSYVEILVLVALIDQIYSTHTWREL